MDEERCAFDVGVDRLVTSPTRLLLGAALLRMFGSESITPMSASFPTSSAPEPPVGGVLAASGMTRLQPSRPKPYQRDPSYP